MNDHIAMFVDSGLSQHWPDLLMAAFVAFGFWVLERSISRNEAVIRERRTTSKNKTSAFPGWIRALMCWKPSFRFVRKRDIWAFVTPAPVVIKHVDIHSD